MDNLIFWTEIIGSVAFAASGTILGIKKHFDIFGIVILAVIATVGGGFMRDLILGVHPPVMFSDPVYCFTAVITALSLCVAPVRRQFSKRLVYSTVMILLDAVGLAIFTASGVAYAYEMNGANHFLMIFTGVITGVGGGLARDIIAGELPYIFRKHVYACAAIIGAVVCAYSIAKIGVGYAMFISSSVIFAIRVLSAYFRINLPRISDEE